MRKRTIRMIGYPITTWFSALAAWSSALHLSDKGWHAADALFVGSLQVGLVVTFGVLATEGLCIGAEDRHA